MERMAELANKDVLTEEERTEAKRYMNDIDAFYRKHFFDRQYGTNEDATMRAIRSNLDLKSSGGTAFAGGMVSSFPFVEKVSKNAGEAYKDIIKGTNQETDIKTVDPFEEAKKTDAAAYVAGDIFGNVAQISAIGDAVKGGMTAAKLVPALKKAGVGAKAIKAIINAITNVGIGTYATAAEATKPGYDPDNFGVNLARNVLLYGTAGQANSLLNGAIGTAGF